MSKITKDTPVYLPLCISSGRILQMCLSIKVRSLRRNCTYKKYGRMDRKTDSVIPIYSRISVFAGDIMIKGCDSTFKVKCSKNATNETTTMH